MWIYNKDNNKWNLPIDKMSRDSFDTYQQDLEQVRFYSKCLSGSVFNNISDLNNLYPSLSFKSKDWAIDYGFTQNGNITDKDRVNNDLSLSEFNKNNLEYNFSLKGYFSPNKFINKFLKNFNYVDVASTEQIDLNGEYTTLVIDGIRLKENNTILIKDQYRNVILANSVNPNDYFNTTYTILSSNSTSTEYSIPDYTNGLYVYSGFKLVKKEFPLYEDVNNLSFSVKLGTQAGKQYVLSKLNNGYYPMLNGQESVLFTQKNNYLLRNQMDYNNLLDINYYDVIFDTYNDIDRYIFVGEYGSILVYQEGYSNFIENNYKLDLKKIISVEDYYYIVGNKGAILKLDKKELKISKIDVNCKCLDNRLTSDLTDISFYNPNLGVIVGTLNTIFITEDGGKNWNKVSIKSFISYNYNKVLWINNSRFYVAGKNGIYIEFNKINNNWIPTQKRISKKIDDQEEYVLTEDIYDLLYFNISNWNPDFSYDEYLTTSPNKELILITSSNGTFILHDLNNSIPDHDFIYLNILPNYGDIKSVINKDSKFYFVGTNTATLDSGIYSFNLLDFPIIGEDDEFSNISNYDGQIVYESNLYVNRLYNNNNIELVIAGNNSITKKSTYSNSLNFIELDITLSNRLKSKLLFLNYDIASKLNFFTDDGVYRIPNGINFDVNSISGTTFELSSKIDELSWLDYWKDSHLTFKYYEQNALNDVNKVLFNSVFKFSPFNASNIVTSININKEDVKKIAPTIDNDTNSKYEKINNINISFPIGNDSLYLYSYIMVYRVNLSYPVEIGDVFRLESSIIDSNFICNKIITNGSSKYIYFISDFNQNIITDLKKESNVKITNLNYYKNLLELESNFNKHYVGYGYNLSLLDNNIQLDPLFNSYTAYYNLSSRVIFNSTQIYELNYDNSFLKFGYTPDYNILDYLSKIDNQYFTPNKEYLALPIYKNLPYGNNTIRIDISGNKLNIRNSIKYVWDTLMVNTFIDVFINNTIKTDRLLITNKYFDSVSNNYVIEFNKKINGQNISIFSIDLVSRRKLQEISYDLSELNTIQTIDREITIDNDTFNTYDLNIKSRFYTNSYAIVLLSDRITKEKLSGIIYTDNDGILSVNITFLYEFRKIDVVNVSNFNNYVLVTTNVSHGIETGSSINLILENNTLLNGFHSVEKVSNNQLKINISYSSFISGDSGYIEYVLRDPFLNYRPIDLIDVGVDKKGKIAIELKEENTKVENNLYRLINVDFSKLRYRLIDGLDIVSLSSNYPWILEAEISNAVIGQDEEGLVWYKGLWECGRWFNGKWISGTWINGDWYNGIWASNIIKDNYINIEYDKNTSNSDSSYWVNGRWFNGEWANGTWFNGRWYSGIWKSGNWYNGIWNNGEWSGGTFSGGVWVNGNWRNGNFNSFSSNGYWLNGEWSGGDFENGMWFNGNFNQKDNESRFGTKSDNSRAAIWQNGEWFNGTFHSRLNINDNKYDVSNIHHYSLWKSGNWYNGGFYGGVAFNINFKAGIWYGGILEDISLIGTNIVDNKLYLDGVYYMNIGYEFHIIGDPKLTEYSSLGTYKIPVKYKVLKVEIQELENRTVIYVDKNIDINITTPLYTGLKIVSYYKGANWKSGIWTNGIFENGVFEGGMWLNGVFYGDWT